MPVRRVRRYSDIWIARNSLGLPTLVVECSPRESIPPPLVLRNLRFDPNLECRIIERGGRDRLVRAATIQLTVQDDDLVEYFLRVMDGVARLLPSHPAIEVVAETIERVVEVFRFLSLPGAKSLQGLWAELLLVRWSGGIVDAATAWHITKRSLFDFDSGEQAVEVKSSLTGIRKHRFKLAQLQPPLGRSVLVASLLLRESADGLSVVDLWEKIQTRLRSLPELRFRLAEVVAECVGRDWQQAATIRFDEAHAVRSLKYFDAAQLPRTGVDAGPEISDIEFSLDLSSCASLSDDVRQRAGGLFDVLPNVSSVG